MGSRPLPKTKDVEVSNAGQSNAPRDKANRRIYTHRDTGEIVEAIEKKVGVGVSPFEVMFLVKMLRAANLTIGAQREIMVKLGRENAELRREAKKSA